VVVRTRLAWQCILEQIVVWMDKEFDVDTATHLLQ